MRPAPKTSQSRLLRNVTSMNGSVKTVDIVVEPDEPGAVAIEEAGGERAHRRQRHEIADHHHAGHDERQAAGAGVPGQTADPAGHIDRREEDAHRAANPDDREQRDEEARQVRAAQEEEAQPQRRAMRRRPVPARATASFSGCET